MTIRHAGEVDGHAPETVIKVVAEVEQSGRPLTAQ